MARHSWLAIIFVLLIGGAVIAGLWFYARTGQLPGKLIGKPAVFASPTSSASADDELILTGTYKKIHLVVGKDGTYNLIDGITKKAEPFTPEGYKILLDENTNIDPFAEYLLLQKDHDLYSYNIEKKKLEKLVSSSTAQTISLTDKERVRLSHSLTESNKFYLAISEAGEPSDNELGDVKSVFKRAFFYNAAENKLTDASQPPDDCYQYDSLNTRFISWLCGEGIGNSIPLSITDLKGKKIKEIVSLSEFGLTDKDLGLISVEPNSSAFFIMGKNKAQLQKVVMVDINGPEPRKVTLNLSEAVRAQLGDFHPYSATIFASYHTLVLGGAHAINLLTYDDKGLITAMKTLPEPEIYANFLHPGSVNLYYQTKDGTVKDVNLKTLSVHGEYKAEPGSFLGTVSFVDNEK